MSDVPVAAVVHGSASPAGVVALPEMEGISDMTLERSLRHCHARGVHSIIVQDKPLVRIFATTLDHDLWRNRDSSQKLSVGFHAHHCALTITALFGPVINVTGALRAGERYHQFLFETPIGGAAGRFTSTGVSFDITPLRQALEVGGPVAMKASEIHTIYVPPKQRAAWLIEEGEEDAAYRPLCYSNHDLRNWDASGLYQAMSAAEARGWLRIIYRLYSRGSQPGVQAPSGSGNPSTETLK